MTKSEAAFDHSRREFARFGLTDAEIAEADRLFRSRSSRYLGWDRERCADAVIKQRGKARPKPARRGRGDRYRYLPPLV